MLLLKNIINCPILAIFYKFELFQNKKLGKRNKEQVNAVWAKMKIKAVENW